MSAMISEASKNAQSQRWSTEDEIAYLRGLGTWGETKVAALPLLKAYESTMHRRRNWEAIDAAHVREVVAGLIRFNEGAQS